MDNFDNNGNQQNQNQVNSYQPVVSEETRVLTVKDWLIINLISCIPCVGIVMLFVWAFGEGNLNRKNYAKGMLIFAAIFFVIGILFYIFVFAAIIAAAGAGMY